MSEISTLGIELKGRRSERTFKILYDKCIGQVVKHCLLFENIEENNILDIYQEVMIDVWNNIGKYDVNKYSISTLIHLKMSQRISDFNKRVKLEDIDVEEVVIFEGEAESLVINTEDEFIKNESIDIFWNKVSSYISPNNFAILFDFYAKRHTTKELSKKYKCTSQKILNIMHRSRKKLVHCEDLSVLL